MSEIYLFGMTVYSTIHLLDGEYPEKDTYGEIAETHQVPGGETGNSALVLAKFGYKVKIDGPFLGAKNRDGIIGFYGPRGVDTSLLRYDGDYPGIQDMILVAGDTRTVFGPFAHYFSGPKRWSAPDRASIEDARIVTIDPFFREESDEAARLCVETGTPYVTIDCRPDSYLHRHAAANIVSNEFIRNTFPGDKSEKEIEKLHREFTSVSDGLVVFTFGSRSILYGRKNGPIRNVTPFEVKVKSTLGAGDTFRAGITCGLLSGFDDTDTVRFAAATAAAVCKRFPFALDPPSKEEILGMIGKS